MKICGTVRSTYGAGAVVLPLLALVVESIAGALTDQSTYVTSMINADPGTALESAWITTDRIVDSLRVWSMIRIVKVKFVIILPL